MASSYMMSGLVVMHLHDKTIYIGMKNSVLLFSPIV